MCMSKFFVCGRPCVRSCMREVELIIFNLKLMPQRELMILNNAYEYIHTYTAVHVSARGRGACSRCAGRRGPRSPAVRPSRPQRTRERSGWRRTEAWRQARRAQRDRAEAEVTSQVSQSGGFERKKKTIRFTCTRFAGGEERVSANQEPASGRFKDLDLSKATPERRFFGP